jgi:replicative DNA helicase
VSQDFLDRVPPQNLEAEASVLGAILLDNEAAWLVAQFLRPEHFYKAAHRRIYETVLALATERRPIDVVILRDELGKAGALEMVGGVEALKELVEAVPSAANAEYYAKLVHEKYLLRSLIAVSTSVAKDAYDAGGPAAGVIDRAEKRFFELTSKRVADTASDIRSLLHAEFDRIDAGGSFKGVMTNLTDLDSVTNGFKPAELVVLAARPSMGKTSLATTFIRNIAVGHGLPVAFYSLEMSKQQVTQNILCAEARVDSFRMRQGRLERRDLDRLRDAAGRLADAPIYVDDASSVSIMEMRAKARMMRLRHKIGLVVIDYLQLMEGEKGASRDENRAQEISQISRGLKQLARELEVPVIALSQLNRGVESREGHKPRLSDLRESGSIEQDADMVLMLFREAYYKPNDEDPKVKNGATIIVAKNRNGPTGEVNLYFHKEYTRFDNWGSGEG